ncbi:MAG TPA: IgGFc-binding protein [Kofleriaceae bacterium]|nr:IgGFc-binding protein [Kofleriaceae bacterium]
MRSFRDHAFAAFAAITAATLTAALAVLVAGCGPSHSGDGGDDDSTVGDDDSTQPPQCPSCTADLTGVVDCDGNVTTCPDDQACSAATGDCQNPCDAAEANHSSVGCEYYAVDMDAAMGPPQDACYTVFVANVSRAPVHLNVEWNGQPIDLARWARLPAGQGQGLTYGAFDPAAGLEPGKVAILFLAAAPNGLPPELGGNVPCPSAVGGAAIGTQAQISGTGKGKAFHLTTDLPVVAYQMLPYGGGAAAATGASLLLPTSAWGDNYVAISAYDQPAPPIQFGMGPSYNIVAKDDGTQVTIRPTAGVLAGGGMAAGAAGQPYVFTLDHGEYAQFTQTPGISGSPIEANQPIGVFGGDQIMSIDRCCGDHGEQMIAPVRALGSEYVAAPHGDRKPAGQSDPRIFRIMGAVAGTELTYDPPGTGPATVDLGQIQEIRTSGAPFTVHSQDADHPFMMFTYMSGAGDQGEGGWGDPDFVRLVPPLQYLEHYVFFTDPTYPFTVLTVVRAKSDGGFKDVVLDCLGPISTWQPVGTAGEYELAYVKLVDHFNNVGACNNGVHTMDSPAPFGVWVWGWGSEDTSTGWVSYGYPAGEAVQPINDIIVTRTSPATVPQPAAGGLGVVGVVRAAVTPVWTRARPAAARP